MDAPAVAISKPFVTGALPVHACRHIENQPQDIENCRARGTKVVSSKEEEHTQANFQSIQQTYQTLPTPEPVSCQ